MRQLDGGTLATSYYMRAPAAITAFFVADGATDPSDIAGHISGVQRLVTAGATPFFRVTFSEPIPMPTGGPPLRAGALSLAVEGVAEADDLTVSAFRSEVLVDAGGDPFVVGEDVDILVRNGGTAVDTAGIAVHLGLLVDNQPRS